MIVTENGKTEMRGERWELSADVICVFKSYIESIEVNLGKDVAANDIKFVFHRISELIKECGYDVTMTDEDIKRYTLSREMAKVINNSIKHCKKDSEKNNGNPFTMGMSGDALTKFLMGLGNTDI